MAKYRKRPVVIEAVQFTKDNLTEVLGFIKGEPQPPTFLANNDRTFQIHTLEGDMRATVGDYLIKGVKGEFYPCKPDIFAETYELIQE